MTTLILVLYIIGVLLGLRKLYIDQIELIGNMTLTDLIVLILVSSTTIIGVHLLILADNIILMREEETDKEDEIRTIDIQNTSCKP